MIEEIKENNICKYIYFTNISNYPLIGLEKYKKDKGVLK